jgi:hypothetical protein
MIPCGQRGPSSAEAAARGWTPVAIGAAVGALTWLAATGRHDLPRE